MELFDNFFVRCDPSYLQQTSPLVILSVAAAVTASLQTHVIARLIWLETVLRMIDTRVSISTIRTLIPKLITYQDPEIREVAGKILDVLSQRLESEYMRIAENDSQSPALRKIPGLARHARELRARNP